MKGLLKNQFYGVVGSGVVLLLFFLITGIWIVVPGNETLLSIYVLIAATVFAFNAASSFRKEAGSKWSKHEIIFPIERKVVVKSRYFNHALWVIFGLIYTLILVGSMLAIRGNQYFYYNVRDPILLFCTGTGIAVIMGAIFYPSVYLLGTDKSEILMVLSSLGSAMVTFGLFEVFNKVGNINGMKDREFYLCIGIYTTLAAVLFVFSYFLTVFIYGRKAK